MKLNRVENLESIPDIKNIKNILFEYQFDSSMIGLCLYKGKILKYWWQTFDKTDIYVAAQLNSEQSKIITNWLFRPVGDMSECPDLPDDVIVGKFGYEDCDWEFGDGFVSLPEAEWDEAVASDNKSELFIGGMVQEDLEIVVLRRGNFDTVVVPFSIFKPSGNGTTPDFSDFSVEDYGHTVRFGDYEAASDAILAECDPEYKK